MNHLFDHHWDNPVSRERVELVFAQRDKKYGAYPIRFAYEKTLARALLITSAACLLFSAIPFLLNLLQAHTTQGKIPDEYSYEFMPDLPVPDKYPITLPPPLPALPQSATIRFTTPVVSDRDITDQPPVQTDPGKNSIGDITSNLDSSSGTDPLPDPLLPDPVNKPIYTWVQEMPTFPGGESAMNLYLKQHIKFTTLARENNISGQVFINFIVDEQGKIKNVRLLRGIGYGCDEVALNAILHMPDWNPGKQNGLAVPVSFNMPIAFTLK